MKESVLQTFNFVFNLKRYSFEEDSSVFICKLECYIRCHWVFCIEIRDESPCFFDCCRTKWPMIILHEYKQPEVISLIDSKSYSTKRFELPDLLLTFSQFCIKIEAFKAVVLSHLYCKTLFNVHIEHLKHARRQITIHYKKSVRYFIKQIEHSR